MLHRLNRRLNPPLLCLVLLISTAVSATVNASETKNSEELSLPKSEIDKQFDPERLLLDRQLWQRDLQQLDYQQQQLWRQHQQLQRDLRQQQLQQYHQQIRNQQQQQLQDYQQRIRNQQQLQLQRQNLY